MLQAANNDLFNPLVPKAHNSESQNLLFHLHIKQLKVNLKLSWRIFIFAPSAFMGLGSELGTTWNVWRSGPPPGPPWPPAARHGGPEGQALRPSRLVLHPLFQHLSQIGLAGVYIVKGVQVTNY